MTHMQSVAADPYPWPYDGEVAAEHTALLVIGAQVGWRAFDTNGEATEACRALLQLSEIMAYRRIFLRYGRTSATPPRIEAMMPGPGEPDWQPIDGLEPAGDDIVIDAAMLNGCNGTYLDLTLRRADVTHLLVCGYGTEAAVHSTLRSLNDVGYECLLVTDACAPVDDTLQDAAVKTITMSGGIFGAVAPLSAVRASVTE